MRLLVAVVLLALFAGTVRADPALDRAIALYRAKDYPAARAALERILASGPKTAAACYYYGMALSQGPDTGALEEAVPWLEQAATLEPQNHVYQGDYGGVCLQIADRRRSLAYANRGRKAMERAIALDPDDLDAREGLMRFFAEAPWPVGSQSRAREQAEEIARRDPARAASAYLTLGRSFEKVDERGAARAAYRHVLSLEPGNAAAAAGLGRLR
ncbi:MAG TPA: tetratricopeptide repeat protein [Opitutaceae bacterium]|nr:tetratricopeptide repeat protein [Opitutaceae bacterium]